MSSSALVLGRTPAGKEALLKDLQAAYLDNQVNSWKVLTLYENVNDCYIQGGFFNWSAQFSVPKWKTMGSQSEILFHEILDVQKIVIDWTTFFFLALKFGRNILKKTPCIIHNYTYKKQLPVLHCSGQYSVENSSTDTGTVQYRLDFYQPL